MNTNEANWKWRSFSNTRLLQKSNDRMGNESGYVIRRPWIDEQRPTTRVQEATETAQNISCWCSKGQLQFIKRATNQLLELSLTGCNNTFERSVQNCKCSIRSCICHYFEEQLLLFQGTTAGPKAPQYAATLATASTSNKLRQMPLFYTETSKGQSFYETRLIAGTL